MNTLVPVRFIRPWRFYKAGAVIRPNGMLRSYLLRSRLAEVVRDESDAAECAMAIPQTEKTVTRRRGRPKGSKNKLKKVMANGTS